MDAIGFVLGVTAKGIRADKLKDLIFRVEDKATKVRVGRLPPRRRGAGVACTLQHAAPDRCRAQSRSFAAPHAKRTPCRQRRLS